MYSSEILSLIACAKALGIERKPTSDNPHAISISGNRDDFPEKLWRLRGALDKVSESYDNNFLALDCVMELLKIKGEDTQDIYAMLDIISGKNNNRPNKRLTRLVEERKANLRLLGGAAPTAPVDAFCPDSPPSRWGCAAASQTAAARGRPDPVRASTRR